MVFFFFVLWALLEFWVALLGFMAQALCFLTRPGATTRGSGGPVRLASATLSSGLYS